MRNQGATAVGHVVAKAAFDMIYEDIFLLGMFFLDFRNLSRAQKESVVETRKHVQHHARLLERNWYPIIVRSIAKSTVYNEQPLGSINLQVFTEVTGYHELVASKISHTAPESLVLNMLRDFDVDVFEMFPDMRIPQYKGLGSLDSPYKRVVQTTIQQSENLRLCLRRGLLFPSDRRKTDKAVETWRERVAANMKDLWELKGKYRLLSRRLK